VINQDQYTIESELSIHDRLPEGVSYDYQSVIYY